jgi:hypothetical protein
MANVPGLRGQLGQSAIACFQNFRMSVRAWVCQSNATSSFSQACKRRTINSY